MTSKKLKVINLISSVCLAVLLCLVVVLGAFKSNTVYAAEIVTGSDVLDDLHKDESFVESNYPENKEDYSLQLIHITESTDGELLVYVYQPSGQTKNLRAVSINLSTASFEDIDPDNYKLTYLNSSGVFFKYSVDGLKVNSDTTRYYAITSIYRPFIEEIDTPAGNDNTITEIPYEVNRQYCFSEINGNPYCKVVDFQTIRVTDKFVGFVRYMDENRFWGNSWKYCDSHFVAFNTDRPIDKLLGASVRWTYQSHEKKTGVENSETFGDALPGKIYLDETAIFYFKGSGWNAGEYEGARITTVEQFITENDLTQNVYSGATMNVNVANKITDDGKDALKGKKWLLRFTETEYSFSSSGNAASGNWQANAGSTLVGEVTILRLQFETNGILYNLGVIDNKQTGSGSAINVENVNVDFSPLINALREIFAIIGIVLLVIALGVIFPPIFAVLKYLFKAVVFVIGLPFKVIGSIFKRRD